MQIKLQIHRANLTLAEEKSRASLQTLFHARPGSLYVQKP